MNSMNNKVSVKAGAVPSGTVNGGSAKSGGGKGSPSGSLAKAPAGKGAELGGAIVGFGSSKPDHSTVNAVGGKLGSAAAGGGKNIRGFSGTGQKPGKI